MFDSGSQGNFPSCPQKNKMNEENGKESLPMIDALLCMEFHILSPQLPVTDLRGSALVSFVVANSCTCRVPRPFFHDVGLRRWFESARAVFFP